MTKILVVDDSVSVRDVVERALASAETQVVSAASGAEAIERIEREHPDLVVCDVFMPDRDGYEVCRFVKTHPELARTPVLLISGTVNRTVLEAAALVRSDDVLGKPFHMTELQRKVTDLLSSVAAGAGEEALGAAPAGAPAGEPKATLTQLGTLPGVRWAALADADGFVVESVGGAASGPEAPAALAAWLAESCAGTAHTLGLGRLHGVSVACEAGTLCLHSVGAAGVLALLVEEAAPLAEVQYWVRKALPALGRSEARPC